MKEEKLNKINYNTITVFEHQILKVGEGKGCINTDQLKALQSYYGNGTPYFTLTHNGVQFKEYVGVLQIGKTLIEVFSGILFF